MLQAATAPTEPERDYPASDGKPMADNTRQLEWIVKLVGNLENLYRDRPDVFAAGNQSWYPVRYDESVVQAPDAYVVFGRPKGHRDSYKQWEENDVPMTVVFEVLSPSNDFWEMADKQAFYDDHGVEEYYVYDPRRNRFEAYVRHGTALLRIRGSLDGFVSPRLGIRFDLSSGPEMIVRYPDGRPFYTIADLDVLRQAAERRAEDEHKRAEDEHKRANEAIQRAENAERRATRLAELVQKALLQQATAEEQEELRSLLALPPA